MTERAVSRSGGVGDSRTVDNRDRAIRSRTLMTVSLAAITVGGLAFAYYQWGDALDISGLTDRVSPFLDFPGSAHVFDIVKPIVWFVLVYQAMTTKDQIKRTGAVGVMAAVSTKLLYGGSVTELAVLGGVATLAAFALNQEAKDEADLATLIVAGIVAVVGAHVMGVSSEGFVGLAWNKGVFALESWSWSWTKWGLCGAVNGIWYVGAATLSGIKTGLMKGWDVAEPGIQTTLQVGGPILVLTYAVQVLARNRNVHALVKTFQPVNMEVTATNNGGAVAGDDE